MLAIVGLGNLGREYSGTRHNVGFEVVEELARRGHFQWRDSDGSLRIANGRIAGRNVVLVEPQLFMNRSGDALAQLDIEPYPESLIVIYDDVDLPLGRIRVRKGGGTGGHRGVESIVERFGSDFTRVRMGIGRPAQGMETATHVLTRFDEGETPTVMNAVREAADAVEFVVEHGAEAAMARFNVRRNVQVEASSKSPEQVTQKE
jgi:PTH1 family peptidyl-tRNA hydrolase